MNAHNTLRTGRKVGRTIYVQDGPQPSDNDVLVGTMDTPELAARVVAAANAHGDLVPGFSLIPVSVEVAHERADDLRKLRDEVRGMTDRTHPSRVLSETINTFAGAVALYPRHPADEPYRVGEEVTGARAVACPAGTTLRSVHGSLAALRAEHGWATTSPRIGDGPAAETVVRANRWTVVDLPEGET